MTVRDADIVVSGGINTDDGIRIRNSATSITGDTVNINVSGASATEIRGVSLDVGTSTFANLTTTMSGTNNRGVLVNAGTHRIRTSSISGQIAILAPGGTIHVSNSNIDTGLALSAGSCANVVRDDTNVVTNSACS